MTYRLKHIDAIKRKLLPDLWDVVEEFRDPLLYLFISKRRIKRILRKKTSQYDTISSASLNFAGDSIALCYYGDFDHTSNFIDFANITSKRSTIKKSKLVLPSHATAIKYHRLKNVSNLLAVSTDDALVMINTETKQQTQLSSRRLDRYSKTDLYFHQLASKLLYEHDGSYNIRLFDINAQKELRHFYTDKSKFIRYTSILPNQNNAAQLFVLQSGNRRYRPNLQLWDFNLRTSRRIVQKWFIPDHLIPDPWDCNNLSQNFFANSICACYDNDVFIWDVRVQQPPQRIEFDNDDIHYGMYDNSGKYFLTGQYNQTINIYDVFRDYKLHNSIDIKTMIPRQFWYSHVQAFELHPENDLLFVVGERHCYLVDTKRLLD